MAAAPGGGIGALVGLGCGSPVRGNTKHTAGAGADRGGLIATFVSQASIVPDLPRVLVGLGKRHHTRGLVEASGAFGLHAGPAELEFGVSVPFVQWPAPPTDSRRLPSARSRG